MYKPPVGCPRSKPGIYWKLDKTLYGLARSAHHWYTKISNYLIDDLGFESMPQDNCLYKCTSIEGQPQYMLGYTSKTLCITLSLIKLKNGLKIHSNHMLKSTSWVMPLGSYVKDMIGI